jgi:hypothetical protein
MATGRKIPESGNLDQFGRYSAMGDRLEVAVASEPEELGDLMVVFEAAETDWRAAAWWLMSRFPEEYAGTTTFPLGRREGSWIEAASWLERRRPNEYAPR